jgi:hypothetical protein
MTKISSVNTSKQNINFGNLIIQLNGATTNHLTDICKRANADDFIRTCDSIHNLSKKFGVNVSLIDDGGYFAAMVPDKPYHALSVRIFEDFKKFGKKVTEIINNARWKLQKISDTNEASTDVIPLLTTPVQKSNYLINTYGRKY